MGSVGGINVRCGIVRVLAAAAAIVSAGTAHAAEIGAGITQWYEGLSLPVPGANSLVVCHGFSCYARTGIALSAADRAKLAQMVRATTPDAERRGIARAVAWFDKRVGPVAGTSHAKAFARGLAGDTSQYDCVDRATNTTSLLVVLSHWGLLQHHDLEAPSSRVFVPILEGPHSTAVLRERRGGRQWAVDSWTRNAGELPEIMPLARWKEQSDRPNYFGGLGIRL